MGPVVVKSISKHTATVVFIHGLGDTGYGWKPVAEFFQRDPALQHIKWILPHAPTMSVTANSGIEMPSWFDIVSFGFKSKEDEEGMLKSAKTISAIINSEVAAGLPADRIVLGGFSQGGCLSLLTGLRSDKKLAGLVALSGWLPLMEKFKSLASPDAASVPIFWGHGTEDPLVPLSLAKASSDWLVNDKDGLGMPKASAKDKPDGLSWNEYQGLEHSTHLAELNDLKAWIKNTLPKRDAAA